ncbi:efflux RND transporter periplasmic adaptor subunit [Undibacterium sp.]|uniref:efflux RND transporter periplasmic adaptor subunit n=1 Tax=Undibacterium sp. TaxID=1914977 RepID=UPI0025ECBDC7|nr:efflux RND transporter periplasmic adaptor subunit [Undibacterium sp.]
MLTSSVHRAVAFTAAFTPALLLASVLATPVAAARADASAPVTSATSVKALAVATVRSSSGAQLTSADGVVEAVRQSVIATQVSGAIVELPVKVGDSVKAGQLLLRMDARAANQEAKASSAQVEAARAALVLAAKDYERQKLLFNKQYISAAQLERAESQFKSASAQANAQIAQAGAVQTQSGFYVLNAPYAGVVAEVPVMLGDMAMPGRPLMTVYDPTSLRVTATVPQARVANLVAGQAVRIEFPGMPEAQRWITASKLTVLPVADAATHTVQLRLDLPGATAGLTPGMFARVNLAFNDSSKANAGTEMARLYVPAKAVFRRAELSAVYVLNAQGQPLLRQVKAGAVIGTEQEILSGVSSGEQVALDPVAAAKVGIVPAAKDSSK